MDGVFAYTCGALAAPSTARRSCWGFGPEEARPCTTAAATAARSATASARTRRREGVGVGRGSSSSTRARSASGARGACARSSNSTVISFADIADPLFQSLECAAEARRARRLADPEHAGRGRAVELEDDAQRDHLALAGRQLSQRLLERAGQSVDELADELLTPAEGILPPSAARLRAEPVDRDVVRDLAQPRARRASARVEATPRAERLLECLGGEILGGRAVAGEVDEVAVDRVELLGDDLGEAGSCAEPGGSVERGRSRVHALLYGATPADRHMPQSR